MAGKLLVHLRRQWIGVIALLLVLTGGTAYALEGSNTVFSDDIVNGEVKNADLAADSVGSGKIIDGQVKNADLGPGASSSNTIADGGVRGIDVADNSLASADIGAGEVRSGNVANEDLTGGDIAANSLKGADIDESTLDVGDAARAYARVRPDCEGVIGLCVVDESKGISSVTRNDTGIYCVTAPGISGFQTPAAVTVDWTTTNPPEGNASAMTREGFGCGDGGRGFLVFTERQPNVTVNAGSGVNNATVAGRADFANGVGFTIVIP